MHAISISLRRRSAINRVVLLPGLWILVCSTLGTQAITYAYPPATPTSAAADPTFEVASVRPNHSGDVSSGEHTAGEQNTFTYDELLQKTANGNYSETTKHPGTDSTTGCGSNSMYYVTWHYQKVATPLTTAVESTGVLTAR
jgi:hypothetical protein